MKRIALIFLLTNICFGTNYYIDYDNGSDDANGLSVDHAWKTITKYTTTTVRTPGDVAYLRSGITWDQGTEAADITFDEDGTIDDYIKIIGCGKVSEGDSDPWGDDSSVKPIIDFEDAEYQINLANDNYWWLERLDIRQSSDSSGQIYITESENIYIKSCDISDSGADDTEGVYAYSGIIVIDSCTFEDCWTTSLWIRSRFVVLKGCTFDAGSVRGSSCGILNYGICYAEDNSFCPSNGFSSFEISTTGIVNLRNCIFGISDSLIAASGGIIFSEDKDGTFEAHKTYKTEGIISRQTASPRSGGADSYAKMVSDSDCGPNSELLLGTAERGFAQIWLTAGVEKTITVYARTGSAWDSALTASEAFLRASYLDSDSDCGRTIVESTETITNDAAWTAFTVTFTPQREGYAYLWFVLAEYEDAGEYIDVDLRIDGSDCEWVLGQPLLKIEAQKFGYRARYKF